LPRIPLPAEIQCPVCGRRVSVRGPPPEGFKDPWAGQKEPRISPHWAKAMPEGEPRWERPHWLCASFDPVESLSGDPRVGPYFCLP